MGDTSGRPAALWCRHLLLRRDLRTWLIHLATPTSVLHPATQTSTRRRYDNSITCTATPSRLADKIEKTSTPRLFLPPWSVEELDACLVDRVRRVPLLFFGHFVPVRGKGFAKTGK